MNLKSLINIGITDKHSLYERKVLKLFNGLSTFGILIALLHATVIFKHDQYAAYFHLSWGVFCILGLLLHSLNYYKFARFMVCFTIIIFGCMASARVGHEYYPHFASLGIMVGAFIFYDIKKEWKYIVFFILLEILMVYVVETNYFKNENISFENPMSMRLFSLIGTIIFVSIEIILLVRLSWSNEQSINQELIQRNKELHERNEEKKVLLQEVHHRVKNNFQIITSLMKLQSTDITDQASKKLYHDMQGKLRAISKMHELMYQSETLGKINLKIYLHELANGIIESSSIKEDDLDIKIEVNELLSLSNKNIVPLALILNELFSNSMKHAFISNNINKKIEISLKNTRGDDFELTYKDNGVWKNENRDGFGLELIALLTEQLSGSLERTSNENGTVYNFKITLD